MPQVGIITGGASGIGLALGDALVRRGWHVRLADINDAAAEEAAEKLTRRGPGSATATCVDVGDADAVAALVHGTYADQERLDLMVNNAGVLITGEPDELLLAHWERAIDVNLKGVIYGCHAAYPLMKKQHSGTILNTSSLSGLFPQKGDAATYGTTKAAVVALSLALRAAGAEYGVHVSVLCPGPVDTPTLDGAWPAGLPRPPSTQQRLTPREYSVKLGWPIYPPEKIAEETLSGLAKNTPILIIPRQFRRSWLLARLMPGSIIRMMEKATTQARQERRQQTWDSEQLSATTEPAAGP